MVRLSRADSIASTTSLSVTFVERARRFIEHQHLRVEVHGARDSDALSLPAREPDAALSDGGVEPVWQLIDQAVEPRDAHRLLDAMLVDSIVRDAERDVATQRVVAEVDLLRDIADATLPSTYVAAIDHDAVDFDVPFCGLEQADQHVGERGLAGARSADEGDRLAAPDGQRDA
jgi:hypothetical protein